MLVKVFINITQPLYRSFFISIEQFLTNIFQKHTLNQHPKIIQQHTSASLLQSSHRKTIFRLTTRCTKHLFIKDMSGCASKESSKASIPREESEEPVSPAMELKFESIPASKPVFEPISAPQVAAEEAQTTEKVFQVRYFGFHRKKQD